MSLCVKAIGACCKFVGQALRPALSIVLGIGAGTIAGVAVTVGVSLFTLVRTPLHICKMLRVTATTKECFKGHWLGRVLRVLVFLLVPLPHLLFLVGVTGFAATAGVLYFIGAATKMIYNCDYAKTLNAVTSNVKLEPTSPLGEYYKACQDFMQDDTKSHDTIYFLKSICSVIPGTALGMLPFLPFSLAILAISVVRVPINMYKTQKIALFTVLLEWDLRLLALLSLPFANIIFPLVMFIGTIVCSFFHSIYITSKSIFEGASPFEDWGVFQEMIRDYSRKHQEFVDGCDDYDHPSGIPNGWRGNSYGLPIQQILWWQWDFLVCCTMVVVSIPIVLAGCSIVMVVKIVPTLCNWWYQATKSYCKSSCEIIIGTWPFFLLQLALVPVGAILAHACILLGATIYAAGSSPVCYIQNGYLAGWYQALEVVRRVDNLSNDICDSKKFSVFGWLPSDNPYEGAGGGVWEHRGRREGEGEDGTLVNQGDKSVACWDRFASQCVKTTAALLDTGLVSSESVCNMDPSAIQSIPAVAVLTILVDSVHEEGLNRSDLKWNIDETVCRKEDQRQIDRVANHLLPLVLEIKWILLRNRALCDTENVELLSAMLCSNSECDTEAVKRILKRGEQSRGDRYAKNNLIRSKVTALVFGILRVKPYQDRMNTIFEHDYEDGTNHP